MRKIIVEAEVSLDGVMGGDNMDFWKQIFSFHSADVQQYLDELLHMAGALLSGRKTYEGFAQVWPTCWKTHEVCSKNWVASVVSRSRALAVRPPTLASHR